MNTPTLALSCAFALTSMVTAAQPEFTLFNDDPNEIIYAAVIYRHIEVFDDNWVAYGWITVPPNECKVLTNTTIGILEVFLSTLDQSGRGGKPSIMHFSFKGTEFKENEANPAERFYCVQGTKFRRIFSNLEEHANCPDG